MDTVEVKTIQTRHQPVRYVDIDSTRWYCQRDLLICGKINVTKICRRDKNFISTKKLNIATMGGSQALNFHDTVSLEYLAHRIGTCTIREILSDIGIRMSLIPSKLHFKERITTSYIEECIPLGWLQQYGVGGYRVDMYLPKWNIVVECDESGHESYNTADDKERTDIINSILGNPAWIRFNPDENGFNINHVIGKIVKLIAKP